ncbi:MAG: hypothetical protein IK133_07550 [Clostridia bacterium]|nr:hypothetical protein [Clostridia bacterium]
MKKVLAFLVAFVLCVPFLFSAAVAETDVQKAIAEAASMSWDDLLTKAKEEIGDNKLMIYSNTSRVKEDTFTEKTGIQIDTQNPNDSEIYEMLQQEVGNNVYGADVVLLQDCFMLTNLAIAEGWLENYVPEEYKANILESDQNPLVCVYLNRLFFYNDGGNKEAKQFKNVWQFADPEFKGTEFKNPMDEKSSMNFLISLTSEKWQTKMAEAYKNYYGKDWESTGEFQNISYEWIYKFLMNCTFVSKDSTIASDIAGGAAGSSGLFVFSKLRSVDASNISICAKDGMEGFGGLLYPIYSMIAANAKYPYAACLYINYLLSTEGYNNIFGSQMGTYSVNNATGISENAISYGDEPLSFWQDCLVIEDAEHVQNVYFEAFDQISQWCASK